MGRKISDGKSVKVAVPAATVIEQGKFCLLDGFFGLATQGMVTDPAGNVTSINGNSVPAGMASAEIVLNIEEAEYETSQITQADPFAKGDKVYWDAAASLLTTAANPDANGNPQNRPVGRVTLGKDANNVIWLKLGPQVQAHA